MYKIKDCAGNIIPEPFYGPELQKVSDDFEFPIEKVVKRKKGQALVKWLGYSDECNTWISSDAIEKV